MGFLRLQTFTNYLKSCLDRGQFPNNKPHHPDIIFNGNPVKKSSYQKHLGMFLDSKLDFDEHIKGVLDKTSKSIGLIRKFFTETILSP